MENIDPDNSDDRKDKRTDITNSENSIRDHVRPISDSNPVSDSDPNLDLTDNYMDLKQQNSDIFAYPSVILESKSSYRDVVLLPDNYVSVDDYYPYSSKSIYWSIIEVSIFTKDGTPVYNNVIVKNSLELGSDLILNFIESLNKFTNEQLNNRLYDLSFADYKLAFKMSDAYIIVILFSVRDDILIGIGSHISEILNALFQDLDSMIKVFSDFSSELFQNEVDKLIREKELSFSYIRYELLKNKIEPGDWEIMMCIICNSNGIPIIARDYETHGNKTDPILISSFMYAVTIFSTTKLKDDLNSINAGRYKVFLRSSDGYLYCIVVDFGKNLPLANNSPIIRINLDLLKSMEQAIQLLDSDLSNVPQTVLTDLVDNFVSETLLQLKMDYLS